MRVLSGYRPTLGLGGDEDVVEVVGHEVAQGYQPTAMLRDGAGTAVPRLLVQACGVEICCWAVVPRRAAVYSAAARAASAADTGRAELVFKAVCARARSLVLLWADTSTAQVNARIN